MAEQKPLRTLKAPPYPPDHFTREEARAAVLAVLAERGETPVFDVIEEWEPAPRQPPPAEPPQAA